MIRRKSIPSLCLFAALAWTVSAQADPVLSGGAQVQIGTGLPLPVGTAGIFAGGTMASTAGTFPPLFILPVAGAAVGQDQATSQGGAIAIPASILTYMADGFPDNIGVFSTNPTVYQVATTLSYAWPSSAATFAPGGAPGMTSFGTAPSGGLISYSGGTKAFGGPATFAIAAGPGAGTYAIPKKTTTMGATLTPIATVWINAAMTVPAVAGFAALVGASNPQGMAAQGAPTTASSATTMFGAVPAGTPGGPIRTLNFPVAGTMCTMWCVGTNGTIPLNGAMTTWSHGAGMGAFAGNTVTNTMGFPWTTGFLTISQPGAGPPEIFFLSGADSRVAGNGNISLVAGSLSTRSLSGPNANRSWVSLPEPSAALGAAGALGVIFLAHALVRRRSN